MFYLPNELQKIIYEYDSTYKDIYDKVIKEIKNFGKFESYDEEFGCYSFSITKFKGIYMYSSDNSGNYKKALKNTFKNSLF